MSDSLTMLRRIRAYHAGRPLPLGATKHIPLARPGDILVLSFVRMGGESAPWGIAWQRDNQREPNIATCAEPRDRSKVATMVTRFVPALLEWLGHPGYLATRSRDVPLTWGSNPFRQLWVPNPTHVEMLHYLAYSYTFARRGEAEAVQQLNALGRAMNWLFRESCRPGQTTVFAATDALRRAYVFPAEDARQGHLGYLLGWLGDGDRAARSKRAHEAEREAVATSLDPELERETLSPLVEELAELKRENRHEGSRARKISEEIEAIITPELQRRVDLTRRAIDVLRRDERPENPGLLKLRDDTAHEYEREYMEAELKIRSGEKPWIPSPETDYVPAKAASRYHALQAAAEEAEAALIHHDRVLQREAVEAGNAIRGRIIEVRDEAKGRGTRPVWVVRDEGKTAMRLREGSKVCVAGLPGREGELRRVHVQSGARDFEVEIKALTTLPKDKAAHPGVLKAADPKLKGTQVILLATSASGLTLQKSYTVWAKGGPGAWLTHAPANDVAREESVDEAVAEE